MKTFGTLFTTFLFLLLAIAAPSYAQQEPSKPAQQEEAKPKEAKPSNPKADKPTKGQEKRAQDHPMQDRHLQDQQKNQAKAAAKQQQDGAAKHQDEARHQQDQQAKQQQKQTQDEQKRQQEEAKRIQKEQEKQQKQQAQQATTQQQARASAPQEERRHDQRVARRIPDDKFRAHFGREHHFHIGHPVIVNNRPRFRYSGYWFAFIDPWPAEWSYDDDCYIDYVDDGYYLFDPVHPGVRIAVTLVF